MHMDFPALILSLLSDDWVFFEDDEIVWDGKHHKIVGIQVNGAKVHGFMDYVNQFTDFDDIQEAANFVVSFLTHLEEDEAFRIPRNRIAQGVRKAIREGDLTGITFANLAACGKAFQVTMNQEDEYICLYDTRLAMGIPHFFDLMARLIWDFRSFMKSQQGVPFDVVFMSVRNIDADEFFGNVNKPVEDHQDNPTVMHVASLPAIGGKVDSVPALVQIETADEDAERDSILTVLNMAALTASIASNGFPQDILDDLERATNGDRSIDLDDLGRRINDLLPSIHCADPRAWTFNCGLRAGNDLYSIAIPDGYRLIENYQEDGLIPVTRDYVAIPGTADDIDIPNCDRLIGASFSSMASDSDTSDNMKKLFIEELRLAVMHKAVPPSAISKDATHYVEDLVAAKNCKCLVSLVGNAGGGFEYYIRPLGAEILDYVRVTFHNAEDLSCEPDFRQAVLGLARSVELSNPCKSELQSSLNGLVEKKSSAQDFDETVSTLANVLAISRNFESEAALNKLEADGVFSEDEAFIVSYIEHIAAFNDSAFRHCEQVFNALESQKRLGVSNEDFAAMVESVKDFHQSFESHFKPNDDDQQRILDSHGDIALPSNYWELAEKLERYSPGYVDERKRQFAEESYVSASKLKLANSVDIPQTKTTPEPEPEVESVRKSESESLADSKTNYKVNHEESSKSKLKRIRSQMNREGIAPLDIVLNSDKRELKGSEFAAASDKVIKALLANRNDRVCKFAANEDEGEVVRYVESLSCEFASSLVDLANLYLDAVDSQIKRGIDCDDLEIMLDKVKEVLGLVEKPPRIKVNNNRIISAATAYKPDDYMDTQQRYSNTASALIARRIDRDRHEAEEIRAKEAARLEEVIARIEEEMSDLFSFVGDDCTHDEARKIMMALDQRTGGAKKEILMLEDELARIGIFKKKRKQEIHDTISKLRKSIQRNESMSSAIKEALERHYELEEKIASLRNTLEWL